METQLGENHEKLSLINLQATTYYKNQYVTMFSRYNLKEEKTPSFYKHQLEGDINPMNLQEPT